jgi:hypothetical protein
VRPILCLVHVFIVIIIIMSSIPPVEDSKDVEMEETVEGADSEEVRVSFPLARCHTFPHVDIP